MCGFVSAARGLARNSNARKTIIEDVHPSAVTVATATARRVTNNYLRSDIVVSLPPPQTRAERKDRVTVHARVFTDLQNTVLSRGERHEPKQSQRYVISCLQRIII